jgi:hypothetical protein
MLSLLPSTTLALAPTMGPSVPQRLLRNRPMVMQEGPGYKGQGPTGVSAKYQAPGMMTRPEPQDSMRPAEVDLEKAAASQPPKDAKPLPESMAGGFTSKKAAFIDSIRVGDGKLAGDLGFDPLQLADSPQTLAWYREAEIKHSRIAMLAALGWPVAEKFNGPLSEALGQPSLLVDGRSPSVVNGGLGNVNVFYWAGALALAIAAESSYLDNQLGVRVNTDYVPGMLNFDPLGLDSKVTRNGEIWAGRVAMVAVVFYALEESITKAPLFPC